MSLLVVPRPVGIVSTIGSNLAMIRDSHLLVQQESFETLSHSIKSMLFGPKFLIRCFVGVSIPCGTRQTSQGIVDKRVLP